MCGNGSFYKCSLFRQDRGTSKFTMYIFLYITNFKILESPFFVTRKNVVILKLGHKTGTVTIYKRLKNEAHLADLSHWENLVDRIGSLKKT